MSTRDINLSARVTYLVCYDIANDKRLKRVFKLCKNYGNHLQYSIFECDLSPRERVRMEGELKSLIKSTEDQVLFVSLGPAEGRGDRVISALGKPYTHFDAPCYVV
jgi:CRISPR-associated protein Cas2